MFSNLNRMKLEMSFKKENWEIHKIVEIKHHVFKQQIN